MADLSPPFISLIKQLTGNSTEHPISQTASTDTPLVQRLRSNLETFNDTVLQEKYSNFVNDIGQVKSTVEPYSDLNTLHVYLEFVRVSLHLTSLLDSTLRVLDKRDRESEHTSRGPPPAPQALLSIADLKAVHGLIQFIVSLGIYPYLLPGIDRMLALRLAHASSVNKMTHLPGEVRSFLLYGCVKVLVELFENPVLGASILSKHLPDVMAALIQICYAPSSPADKGSSHTVVVTPVTPGDIGHQPHHSNSPRKTLVTPGDSEHQPPDINSPHGSVNITEITAAQQEWCEETLRHLLSHTYQPLVVRELLSLQGLSAKQPSTQGQGKGSSGRLQGRGWVQRSCGRLLSERLVDKNGVENVLKAVHDPGGATGGGGWRKYQAVATVIASCPAQASSVEEYYALVCPQVLGLLHSAQGREDFVKVAMVTMSVMLTRQRDLAMKYLIGPLVEPLSQLSSGCPDTHVLSRRSLIDCVSILHKVVCTVEPSSPLLSVVLSHSPLFFHVWLAGRGVKNALSSIQCKEVLSRVLRTSAHNTALALLCHISGLPPPQNDTPHVQFHSPHPTVFLVYTGTPQELTVRPLMEEEVIERQSAEEMERVGCGVVTLLISELKQDGLVGSFFLLCLRRLSSILAQQTGTPESQESSVSPTERQEPASTSSSTTSTLLVCEARLPPSLAEAFSNSLVLYITAALCEEHSSTVLEQVCLPDLLICLDSLVASHARYCEGMGKVVLRRDSPDEVLGGPITLSVAFGLLSALLSGAVQVERNQRFLLTQLQPSLVTIATSYPHKELASLANELNVCIATLGAVWSTEAGERGVAQMVGTRDIVKKGLSQQTKNMATTRHSDTVMVSTQHPTMGDQPSAGDGGESVSKPATYKRFVEEVTPHQQEVSLYQQAVQEVSDPLLPVKGHGLISLTKLIESKDEETLSNTASLLPLFTEYLKHEDSYLYLAAINGLVSLASLSDTRGSVIATLCQNYAQLPCPPSRERALQVVMETGQLREDNRQADTDTHVASSGHSVEVRMKLGEALVRVARRCGDLLPHYLDQITAAIFTNVKDSDPLIRASSLSNLADVCAGVPFSFTRIRNEVIGCVRGILEAETEVKVRQAALMVLKLIIKTLSKDVVEGLGEELSEVYRLVKHVESNDVDELTRGHSQAVLGELDSVMRECLFPEQTPTLSKKISVLDLM